MTEYLTDTGFAQMLIDLSRELQQTNRVPAPDAKPEWLTVDGDKLLTIRTVPRGSER